MKKKLDTKSIVLTALALCCIGVTACSHRTTPTPAATPVETRVTPLWNTPEATIPATPAPIATQDPNTFSIDDVAFQTWINENLVTALVSDSSSLWAATPSGLVRWNLNMQQHECIDAEGELLSTAISALSVDGANRLWISYNDRTEWTCYDEGSWQSMSRNEAVEQGFADIQNPVYADTRMWAPSSMTGWVWIPAENGMVQAFDGSIWRTYGPYSGVRDNIQRVTVSANGRVWALGDGLCTALEGYVWWNDHTLFADIPDPSNVTGLACDSQERIWLSYTASDTSGGLCNLDLDRECWTGYVHALNPAIPEQVRGLEITDDQSLYIWGEEGLAVKETELAWQATGLEDHTIYCSFADTSGHRWLGTDHGILRINPAAETIGPWLLAESNTLGRVFDVAAHQNELLLATDDGLVHIQDQHIELLSKNTPLCLSDATEAPLWYSLHGLLASTDTTKPRLQDQNIVCALGGDEQSWAYSASGTLWELDGTWQPRMNWLEQVRDPIISMTFGPQGTVYLATPAQIYCLDDQGLEQLVPWQELTISSIQSIAVATDGTVWVGASNGLFRTSDGTNWVLLSTESTGGGLQSMDVREIAFDSKGNLWCATKEGISYRTPEADWFYLTMPETLNMAIGDENTIWGVSSAGLYRATTDALTPAF